MFTRIALLLSASFWVIMNCLLWRSEFGGPDHLGNSVPADVVWRKILTSPDNSSLDILHHGKREGYARWSVSERGDAADKNKTIGGLPAASPASASSGFRLDLEGGVAVDPTAPSERVHFDASGLLDASRAWQKLDVHLGLGDDAVDIHSRAADQIVHLRTQFNGDALERVFTFAELQDPRSLADAFDIPLPLELSALAGLPPAGAGGARPLWAPVWEARSGRVKLGHAMVRAYRLRTRFLDRWQVVIVVSPVGEILRVELPDDWVLASDEPAGL